MRGLKWLLAAALLTATVSYAGPVARADEPAASESAGAVAADATTDALAALKSKDALLTAKLKKIARETDNASAFFHRRWCGWGGWRGCGWGGWGGGWCGYRSYCYTPCYSYNYCYTPAYYAPSYCYRSYYPTVAYYAPAVYAPVSYVGYGGCFYW